jgi:hypothetical protein
MDLALNIVTQASVQIALFVTPILVLLSFPMGHPLDLVFSTFELLSVVLAVAIVAYLVPQRRNQLVRRRADARALRDDRRRDLLSFRSWIYRALEARRPVSLSIRMRNTTGEWCSSPDATLPSAGNHQAARCRNRSSACFRKLRRAGHRGSLRSAQGPARSSSGTDRLTSSTSTHTLGFSRIQWNLLADGGDAVQARRGLIEFEYERTTYGWS